MRVAVWTSERDGAIARIEVPGLKKGSVEFLPTFFHGPTVEGVTARAEAFYASELERLNKSAATKAASASRRAAAKPDEEDFPV